MSLLLPDEVLLQVFKLSEQVCASLIQCDFRLLGLSNRLPVIFLSLLPYATCFLVCVSVRPSDVESLLELRTTLTLEVQISSSTCQLRLNIINALFAFGQ